LLLYYITDRSQFAGGEQTQRLALLKKVAEAASGGVDFIQLREKDLPARELERLARQAIPAIRDSSGHEPSRTRLLINSRTDVALACGADGVHLRSDDVSPGDVRSAWNHLPREKAVPVISVSCHSAAAIAQVAAGGADLALFAPVFEKPGSAHSCAAGLETLREACRQGVPVLALGGVTAENAQSCIEAGAAGVAGIRLFQQGHIREIVKRLRG